LVSLNGKVSLVTGASRGIGRATAIKLAKLGSDVAVNYLQQPEPAHLVCRKIESFKVKSLAIQADVADYQSVQQMVKKIVNKWGRIDILINNAGVTRDNLLVRLKEEDWDKVINVNLKGCFNCLQAVAKVMIKQRQGAIINLSSVVGIKGNFGQTNYAASKGGIIGLTVSAAKELASRNIRVNAVAPGFIETKMTDGLSEDLKHKVLERISLRRFGKVDEVANLIAFLASDLASYITGQTIVIDGGLAL
jgi:3-oxoacyl-[acyl-carrier protein] reductase